MNKTVLASAIAGLAVLGAGAAIAGEKGDWEAKLEAKFAKLDANGDGVVSEAEYLAAKEAKAKENFDKVSGGDGELTLEEAKAAQKAKYEEKKKKKMKKKDG